MTFEIEAKVQIDSLEPIAERLAQVGARFASERVQNDAYFADLAGQLAGSGCGLRLRMEAVDGQSASLLTFKGPRRPGLYKTRPEFQTAVADGAAMTKILEGLGYKNYLTVTKMRRVWELDDCEVCLDKLPLLGCFVEVEGPDEAVIKGVLTKLGLADRPHISRGYAAMMAKLTGQSKSSISTP